MEARGPLRFSFPPSYPPIHVEGGGEEISWILGLSSYVAYLLERQEGRINFEKGSSVSLGWGGWGNIKVLVYPVLFQKGNRRFFPDMGKRWRDGWSWDLRKKGEKRTKVLFYRTCIVYANYLPSNC